MLRQRHTTSPYTSITTYCKTKPCVQSTVNVSLDAVHFTAKENIYAWIRHDAKSNL